MLVFILQGNITAALALFLVALLSDNMDDALARALRQESALTKRLDHMADVVFSVFTIIPLLAVDKLSPWILLLVPISLLGLAILHYKVEPQKAFMLWSSESGIFGIVAANTLYLVIGTTLIGLPSLPFEILAIFTGLLANLQWLWLER
jgi:phosphatidylglycerophosphate synthase